jgi:hypothetical protein
VRKPIQGERREYSQISYCTKYRDGTPFVNERPCRKRDEREKLTQKIAKVTRDRLLRGLPFRRVAEEKLTQKIAKISKGRSGCLTRFLVSHDPRNMPEPEC